MAQTGHVA